MVERQLPKLDTRVRFPSPAPHERPCQSMLGEALRPSRADVVVTAYSLHGLSLNARLPDTFERKPHYPTTKDIDLVQMRADLDRVIASLHPNSNNGP